MKQKVSDETGAIQITRSFIQSGFNEVSIRARGGTQPRTSQKPHDSTWQRLEFCHGY
jgi:hypothetical protein